MQRTLQAAGLAAILFFGLTACSNGVSNQPSSPAAPAAPASNAAPAAPAQPAAAPAASGGPTAARLKNQDGSTFTIADVEGRAKVVNFWATWCAPCIGEMPVLNAMSKRYADKGVTFVAVSVDEGGPADVAPVLKKGTVKIDFRLAYASFDDVAPMNVSAPIPDTLVFDAQNQLVEHFDKVVEAKELEAAIDKALAASAK